MAAIILLMAASFSAMKPSAGVLAARGAAQLRLTARRIKAQIGFEGRVVGGNGVLQVPSASCDR